VYTKRLYGFFAPGAYADEHISHYTRSELIIYSKKEHFTWRQRDIFFAVN
jgi:hypothetical protein